MVGSSARTGDAHDAFVAVPGVQEAHDIAGKRHGPREVRTATAEQLRDVLRRLYAIGRVGGTQATVVLETLFERPIPASSGLPGTGSALLPGRPGRRAEEPRRPPRPEPGPRSPSAGRRGRLTRPGRATPSR
ncbi:Lrp/AsnC ligand binding domain-containing protein [Streptomyces sp. MUM 203J]|nr:Lrp/AsnC ligand binding domain-containing protein [Streptomyces sp. MUM 203J]